MTWGYSQETGHLTHDGAFVAKGYSGKGMTGMTGRNNPIVQGLPLTGPIPVGSYRIGPAYQHLHLGAVTMNLTPIDHNALGRTVFRIHGNNKKDDASEGCIILDLHTRQQISASNDRLLVVTIW